MPKPKIINSTSVGNTRQDNTKVISKQPIRIKLTPEQIAALEKQKYEELINKNKGTLKEVSRKDIERANRNDKILEAIGWQDKAGKPGITQGLAKTVGASALIATGAAYSSPVVNTFAGLGKNAIAGAIGAEGFSMLDGRVATPTELAISTGMEMGMPMVMKGTSKLYGKMFNNKTITPVIKNTIQEVAPVTKNESVYQPTQFQIEKPTTNTLQLKSTMLGSPLEKQLSKDGMLSINSLQAHLNNQSTSMADRTMIQKVLNEKFAGQSKINYNDLRKAVSDEMVPLEKNFDSNYSNYGVGSLGYPGEKKESIEKAISYGEEFIRNSFKDRNIYGSESIKSGIEKIRSNRELLKNIPKENTSIVYSNKEKFGKGSTDHFANEGTLGHSRILVSNEEPDVMHILEQQSDYYQKNPHEVLLKQLDDVKKSYKEVLSDPEYNKSPEIIDFWKNKVDEITKKTNAITSSPNEIQKELLSKTHQERLLQENVAHAAQNGQTKMRYPTPETAAKIQGYTKKDFSDVDPILKAQHKEKVKVLFDEVKKHGDPYELYDKGHPAAVAWNNELESWQKYLESVKKEQYSPEHQTILKKYADNPKMIKKLLGVDTRTVTDVKGNSWYEFDIPEAFKKGKAEIKALSTIGAVATGYDITNNKTKYQNDDNMKNNNTKPKYFLGAVLGGAQLAMGAINMIQQNKMQKEQVSKENALVAEQDALAMKQKLDIEDVNQRNFGVNTPMHSFYANGGVKPTATNISTVVGPKHEQGGVDYKNAEVEGGEVIKHEGSNDFIFTDDMRIPFDDKHTYAEVAKQLSDDKGMLEKVAGAELLKHDKFIAKLNKSGSVTEASANKRKAEVAKFKADAIDKDIRLYDSKLEELKIDQLQKGMALGLYNEDGTPKDTKGKFELGAYIKKWNGDKEQYEIVWDPTASGESNPYEVDDAGSELNFIEPEIKQNFLAKADNFMGSNQGQAIMGLANAGLNLASNIATTKNMAKLKTPSYIPLTVQDTPLANLSATRQSIEESSDEQSKYATENFSNPQVAAIMKAKIEADKIENLGKVNQQEQTVNLDITNANISRRMGVEQANNQGLQQKQMMDYQKASADINNASNITAALTKDFGDVITNYRKGVMEDKTMDLYGKSFAGAVTDELRSAIADNVDLQKVREMTQDEALQYFADKGVYDKSKISNYLRYAKK